MEIRKLTIDNYKEILELWAKAGLPFRPQGRDSYEAIKAEMDANADFFLGAFEEGKLVGTIIISSDLRKGWINRLAVDPAYRNRGVARAMITRAEEILRKRGIGLFCALIEDYNTASKKLFKKCGYVEHRDILYFSKRDSNDI